MKHPLYVGHFDVSVRSFRPKVNKPIELNKVHTILAAYCDKVDGTLAMAALADESAGFEDGWLGRIEQEDVKFKAGYLICPWLGAGINEKSVRFICELQASLGVQIYDPGDARYFSPEELADAEREFYQSPNKRDTRKKKSVTSH
jgi:hypothetical protein